MKYSLILFFCVIFQINLMSQNYWKEFEDFNTAISKFSSNNSSLIIAGNLDTLMFSNDDGVSFQNVYNNLPPFGEGVGILSLLIANDNSIYASIRLNGVYKSTDNGSTWIKKHNEGMAFNLIQSQNGEIYFYTLSGKIFRSDDNGENFNQIGSSITGLLEYSNESFVSDSKGNLFLLFHNYINSKFGVLLSTDKGNNWDEVWVTNLQELPTSIFIDKNDKIYFSLYSYSSNSGMLYFSENLGNSWEVKEFEEFPSKVLTNSMGYLFVATYNGILFTKSINDNLIELNDGLEISSIYAMQITDSDIIYLSGKDDEDNYKTYYSTNPTSAPDPQNIISNFDLSQNYPNPFNPTTVIEYTIPNLETLHATSQMQNVTLKVFDLLGREVATLVNEQKKPGNYQVQFDASNLSSGLYIYKIQAGSFSQGRKMIFLK
ncbi:MAG: T9SS type A sorting domain-containing protein [Melioribacteraceae bacterium]|nr:T9SS type A sorting domain-containing protein [Melioribacteraceae bacterium]